MGDLEQSWVLNGKEKEIPVCPTCKERMALRSDRKGNKYYRCRNCQESLNLNYDKAEYELIGETLVTKCPSCGGTLRFESSIYGKYARCVECSKTYGSSAVKEIDIMYEKKLAGKKSRDEKELESVVAKVKKDINVTSKEKRALKLISFFDDNKDKSFSSKEIKEQLKMRAKDEIPLNELVLLGKVKLVSFDENKAPKFESLDGPSKPLRVEKELSGYSTIRSYCKSVTFKKWCLKEKKFEDAEKIYTYVGGGKYLQLYKDELMEWASSEYEKLYEKRLEILRNSSYDDIQAGRIVIVK